MNSTKSGCFRTKKSFTMASNAAIRDCNLSLKAKGLYTLIMSYITTPDFTLSKSFLSTQSLDKEFAFKASWNELKNKGYLKTHISPSGTSAQFQIEYELLDEANTSDGIHTYYYNAKGEITGTNLSRQKKKETEEVTLNDSENTIKETEEIADSNWDVPSQQEQPEETIDPNHRRVGNRIYGNHTYGDHIYGKRGNKIILKNNTENNTISNPSIYQEDRVMEKTEEAVIEEITQEEKIPYSYAHFPKSMEYAIHYLTEYQFRHKHPYMTHGIIDDQRMNAFQLCVQCLIEMSCNLQTATYRGSMINYANVIDAINRNASHCEEGGLSEFIESAVDTLIHAYETVEIKDFNRYTKSLIWNCFSTYKVELDAACTL